MTVENAELPDKAINYEEYFRLPEDIREYITQFSITEDVIPLIRKGMHNPRIVMTELMLNGQSVICGKPVYIKINQQGLIVKTPTVKFTVPFSAVNLQSGKSLQQELIEAGYEPEKLFGDFCIYSLQLYTYHTKFGEKQDIICNGYKIIAKKTDVESAKKLIEKCGVIPAFNRILGYKDDWSISRLNFIRLFSVVSGNHIFQLTGVNTGKTHFSIRCMLGLNYGYFTTAITPARLIYNAQTRTEGEVFLRNGIIIDELSVIKNLDDMEENLYSGLENGVWTRGVSGAEALAERKRKIPFLFFGNLPGKPLNNIQNTREYIGKILEQIGFHNVSAFLDRIAITDIFTETINVNNLINNYFYPNSILRGFVEILKEQYRKNRVNYQEEYFSGNIEIGQYKLSSGRLNRYANDLKCFADVCGIDLSDVQVKNIIYGHITELDTVFKELFGVKEEKQEEKTVKPIEINQQVIAEDIIEVINKWGGSASLNIIVDTLHKKYKDITEDKLKKTVEEILNGLIQSGVLTTEYLTDGIITYCLK